jgi:prolipoprotein diacylglyceryltransferase
MQQVLFHVPIFQGSFGPDGLPVYGFGAMLFVCFVVVTLWGTRRAKAVGMPGERFQDMVIWLFVSGIIGARVLYMIQYADHFQDKSIAGLVGAFFKIWEGGIVFYGSALGGTIGYGLFYHFVLRRLNVSGWQLADAVAPLLALGLAIGRIGCYLNGCCWGQVACEECRVVPLGPAHFPILPAHARPMLVRDEQLQTTTGFAVAPRHRASPDDPRSVVTAVEAGSPAAKADLKIGDRIATVNGEPNSIRLDLAGSEDRVKIATGILTTNGGRLLELPEGRTRVEFDDPKQYLEARKVLDANLPGVTVFATDRLEELAREWPRGREQLRIGVERNGQVKELTFTPVTVGLFPTQLYETVSMVLLILFLLAYYPYRRHDGQLLVVLMVGYAIHRFVNESLRIEPSYGLGLTLSQWGSVIIFALAVGIEIYLWRTSPSRWKGEPPAPQPGVSPTAPAPPAEVKPS